MSTNTPGLCMMAGFLGLFAALTMIAWHQDAALDLPLPDPASEYICDRLSGELAEQVKIKMISRRDRYQTVTRCLAIFK